MAEERDEHIELYGDCLFVSDAHLGVPEDRDSELRECLLLQLLSENGKIDHLFLLGDIFDFWFEYRDVVPRGYFRLFSLLHGMKSRGIRIHYFAGNHDMWVRDYFKESFGAEIYRKEQKFTINGRSFLIAHGDGLGGRQGKYNFIKKIFNFKPNQVVYSALHPRIAFAIARFFSSKSRNSHTEADMEFRYESEHQVQYARDMLEREHFDFFIFGHRHIPVRHVLTDDSVFFNAGDWFGTYSYITFKRGELSPKLEFFNQKQQ